MPVLGTAGHVDHGKSSVLRVLTSMEPDRLPEEKKRGMTIDLNFVWYQNQRGVNIGIVDVPGHQRFVRNMISGALPVEGFLFVLAADDGWMPQSEEHLRVLKGLGVCHGLGILTKTDLVDPERLASVREEFSRKLESAFGRMTPIVDFSLPKAEATTLRREVEKLVDSLPPPPVTKFSRLWIDRVFVPKGQGVVVTGTLREGSLSAGDDVLILPEGISAHVRGIQAYHQNLARVEPVTRVAVSLSRIEAKLLQRGSVLVKDSPTPMTRSLATMVEWFEKPPLRNRELSFHWGTTHRSAKVILLDKEDPRLVKVGFEKAIPILVGDHFALRAPGGESTLGMGRVIAISVKGKHAELARALKEFRPGESLRVLAKEPAKTVAKAAPADPLEKEREQKLLAELIKGNSHPVTLEPSGKEVKTTLSRLTREKKLYSLGEAKYLSAADFLLHAEKVTRYLKSKGQASTGELRELLGWSRKESVALLEKMDSERLTYLKDNVRRLLKS